MAPSRLQNPYEERQNAVLGRILVNVDKLNEALLELTKSLGEINAHNQQTVESAQQWQFYTRNVRLNLSNEGKLEEPV
ncbi:hypothetical protein P389DRAFT_196391 [Cystobasidium minutum MCA 4210]|uniref:uncharacterized protein n=1 Tax=Cystobasidium minutum MCA 4210 TaxID=1397322 RepID=UPI0034CF7251|eukprot:jgi/Rhomi1/196391/gm1.4605_g